MKAYKDKAKILTTIIMDDLRKLQKKEQRLNKMLEKLNRVETMNDYITVHDEYVIYVDCGRWDKCGNT